MVINAETIKLCSLVSEDYVASNGSAGARKLMKNLGLISCQELKYRYRKALQGHIEISNHLDH